LNETLTESHQSSPAFCGLGTLATILNALGCDPHRAWKGVWRYYTEELLDCCVSLDQIEKDGIDFDNLECLARCNGLKVIAKRTNEFSVEYFRQRVLELTQKDDIFIAVSYSRKALNQTGDGHWSPIGGYDKESDMVLILDQVSYEKLQKCDVKSVKLTGKEMIEPGSIQIQRTLGTTTIFIQCYGYIRSSYQPKARIF
jgi:hypothetical protein